MYRWGAVAGEGYSHHFVSLKWPRRIVQDDPRTQCANSLPPAWRRRPTYTLGLPKASPLWEGGGAGTSSSIAQQSVFEELEI